jgi:DNA-directed RNA polymerase specialized sigma subunit
VDNNIYEFNEILSETVVGIERAIRTYDVNKSKSKYNSGFAIWCKICISSIYGSLYQKRVKELDRYFSIDSLDNIDHIKDFEIPPNIDHIRLNNKDITLNKIKYRVKQIIDKLITKNCRYKSWIGMERVMEYYYINDLSFKQIAKKCKIKGSERKVTHDLSQQMIQLERYLREDEILKGYYKKLKEE